MVSQQESAMPRKKSAESKPYIPNWVQAVFDEYGFDEKLKLEDAVASRSANEWFAILFKSTQEHEVEEGPFWAIDFRVGPDGWEVQNDYVGPFESILAFETEKLTQTFL
jgi:hypothetical protein